jgi:predicted MPP superfamily phosphohydrolase
MTILGRKFIGACVAIAIGGYAFLIEPRWVEVTYHKWIDKECSLCAVLFTPYWTQVDGYKDGYKNRFGVPPFRFVQLSDLHLHQIGMTEESVIDKVNALAPDILFFTGDIADRPESLPILDSFLSGLKVAQKVAVLGNWEYWGGVDLVALKALYERHNVKLLVNECVQVPIRHTFINVAGLDDDTAGKPDQVSMDAKCPTYPGQALQAPKNNTYILMQHSPGYFAQPRQSEGRSILRLSGHTHGGQVALFGYTILTPPGSGNFTRGWYGNLYVSRGVGTSVLPVRLGSRPEVAVFEY